MSTLPVISLRNASKQFLLPQRKDATLLSKVVRTFSGDAHVKRAHSIEAVTNVSFNVQRGEVIGIVGKNASGKTTLLRLIAGIMRPDSGEVHVRCSVTSLINLSVGFQQRLTVRDNITLACALFGMSREETRKCFLDIITFGELEKYTDFFPYQLSTGFNQRLSFSIAVHVKPEILLLDEVFSAGDIAFKKKAEQRMEELIRGDVTVVMVSHSLNKLRKLSDRVLWMEQGTVKLDGPPDVVIDAYEYADSCSPILAR